VIERKNLRFVAHVSDQARTFAFSRSNSSAVMTPRSRRSASFAS
jgi:hypothetical protein